MRKISLLVLFLCLVVSAKLRADETAPRYAITDLVPDTKNKRTSGQAYALNNHGDVVVKSDEKVFLWSNGQLRPIGTFPDEPNHPFMYDEPLDINDKREVIIRHVLHGDSALHFELDRFYLWRNGVVETLKLPPAFGLLIIKINNRSQIMIGTSRKSILRENKKEKSLGDLQATDINDKGQVIGNLTGHKLPISNKDNVETYAEGSDPDIPPFNIFECRVWAAIREYGITSDTGPEGSTAFLINNNRDIVLKQIARSENKSGIKVFLRRQGEEWTLSDWGDYEKSVNAMNDDCHIVGTMNVRMNSSISMHAAFWQNGKWHDLNDLIAPGSGWVLEDAKDINESGQIIGNGKLNGKTRAFLLTPISHLVKGPG